MTAGWFLVVAIAMIVLALVWVLPALMRRRESAQGPDGKAVNVELLRHQQAELENDLRNGTLSQQEYQLALGDLQRRAVTEIRGYQDTVATRPAGSGRFTAWVLMVVLPVAAAALYLTLGNPAGIELHGTAANAGLNPAEVEAMVAKLAARLEREPNDGNGWALLARSYAAMQKMPEALRAYDRATQLIKDDAGLLADYAEVLAFSQNRNLEGQPLKLIDQALKMEPTQWKALALAGAAAFERKDYQRAIEHWEHLRQQLQPDSEIAKGLDSRIAQARELVGKPPPAAAAVKSTADVSAVRGTVSLSFALAGRVSPTDTLFVFARAAQGPRVPLAILRRQVKDLPLTFSLDDGMAMSPDLKLSNFSEVVIGARISKSGNATAQSGDLQGFSGVVKVGAGGVAVVIDAEVR